MQLDYKQVVHSGRKRS